MISLEQARQSLPADYVISDEELTKVVASVYEFADLVVDDFHDRTKQTYEKR